MKILTCTVILSGAILMQGCIVKSGQLSTLINLVQRPDKVLSQNAWIVNYKNYQSIVYAVNISEGTLFANAAGDQILFDGWTVRRISGLGRRGLDIKINEADGVRTFKQGISVIASHVCQQWERYIHDNKVSLSQNCIDRRDYTNSILILGDGSISVIHQIVDDRYTPLTLTKVK